VKPGLSPTGRALRALELLQAQPGTTAAQLAAQLGVTERAARRYVAILREAALGKIIRALPETIGRQAAIMRQHASAVPTDAC